MMDRWEFKRMVTMRIMPMPRQYFAYDAWCASGPLYDYIRSEPIDKAHPKVIITRYPAGPRSGIGD